MSSSAARDAGRPAGGPDRPGLGLGGTCPTPTCRTSAIDTDDEAAIFYTSGTTGKPKGALGTHRNLMTNILSSAYVIARAALRRGEAPPEPTPKVGLLVIPLFHVTALQREPDGRDGRPATPRCSCANGTRWRRCG